MRQGSNARRPRGRTHRKQHGGSPRHNSFDSAGPEGRIRGNAHQVYEKYVALARDAMSSGDRISAETYYQHAEHYYRILNARTDPRPNGEGQTARHGGNGQAQPAASDGGTSPAGQERPAAGMGEQPVINEPVASEPPVAAHSAADGEKKPAQGRRRRKPAAAAQPEAEPQTDEESEAAGA